MGCPQVKNVRRNKDHIKELAVKASILKEEDMQLFYISFNPPEKVYHFEPINKGRKNVIEYIKYNRL